MPRFCRLPRGGIDSVRSLGTECYRSDPFFVDSIVGEGFTIGMLTVPNGFRQSVLKSNHVVLPISNVISDFLEKIGWALIISVKVYVECINLAAAMIINDDSSANSSGRLARVVWLYPFEPRRIFSHIVHRSEGNIGASECVQRGKIVKAQRTLEALNCSEIGLWLRMHKLGADV